MARPVEHGHAGPPPSPEYQAWTAMKRRCLNKNSPNFKNYGGRGITICAQWLHSFPAFLRDVGARPSPKHSIDRRDNNGNYEPGNVQWSTARVQCSNRRNTRRLTLRGETKTIADWARTVGVHRDLILRRLASGDSADHAVFTPSRRPRLTPS